MNAVFAGTFDPFTLGHLDIVQRVSKVFDTVFIAVAKSQEKNCMFNLEQRQKIVKASLKNFDNVIIKTFDGLLTDFCKENKSNILVRGLRTVNDFEYERSLSIVYKDLDKDIESFFLVNNPAFSHIHSSIIRQLIRLKADISHMVQKDAIALIDRYSEV